MLNDSSRFGVKSLRDAAELIGIIVGILSVMGIAIQLYQSRQQTKVERVLSFVERFNSDRIIDARQRLEALTGAYNRDLVVLGQPGLSNDQITTIVLQATEPGTAGSEEILNSILLLTSFFDEVSLCEIEGLCNSELVCQYFSNYASDFWETFGVVTQGYVKTNNADNLGSGLDNVRSMSCSLLYS